jgi:DNA-binding NtrC family response regulator
MSEQKSFNKNTQPEMLKETASVTYSLSGHKDKLLPLINHFIKEAGEQLHTDHKELSKETEDYLLTYDWPGGEKELETAVKKACILSDEAVLHIEDFDLKHRQAKSIGKFVEEKLKGFMQHIKRFDKFNLYDMVIPEVERSLILMILKETKGNQIKAAKLLGINRNTLRTKIKKLKISMKHLQK